MKNITKLLLFLTIFASITSFSQIQTREYVNDNNTVLLLHLNESNNSIVYDMSGKDNHGIITGNVETIYGKFNKAKTLNGGYITGNINTNYLQNDFTLEMWIKTKTLLGGPILTFGNLGVGLYVAGNGLGFADIGINNGPGTNVSNINGKKINDDVWHHIAGVRSQNIVKLYVDGELDCVKSVVQEPNFSSETYVIKCDGSIDEIRVSNIDRFSTKNENQLYPPSPLYPINSAINIAINPALSWNYVIGATSYELQVSPFSNFDICIFDGITIETSRVIGPLSFANVYYWRVRAINANEFGEFSTIRTFRTVITLDVEKNISYKYALEQNYPNPFNPSTKISFSIAKTTNVKLEVFDMLGKLVKSLVNEEKAPGFYSIEFNAKNIPSGVYVYTIKTNEFSETKRMVLVK